MSSAANVRRADKALSDDETTHVLEHAFSGHVATTGSDGFPYCVPLLFVFMDGKVWVHATAAKGHLRSNVDHDDRVCFTADIPGEVFPYGRFECDTTVSYQSVVAYGRIAVVDDRDEKHKFCNALMDKYGDAAWDREKEFYPRLNQITVYAITIERMTGKANPLPQVSEQWPALDRSKTPNAKPLE